MGELDGGEPRLAVLLGAPRSGTTWLQRLLSSSPAVASPQETHLFRLYLEPQLRQWEAHQARVESTMARLTATGEVTDRLFGLPTVLTRADLIQGQRAMVDAVVAQVAQTRPGARLVLEKTPSNSLCVDLIEELCPSVRYVHIVRDPRDVVSSLRAAGQTWGPWAPTDAASGAAMWRRHVTGAWRAGELAPDRYVEIRYEDLRHDPVSALGPVLRLLELDDHAEDLLERERCTQGHALTEVFAFRSDLADRIAGLPEAEPGGFRRGDARRRAPSAADLRMVAVVAGDTAQQAGYLEGWPAMGATERAAWDAAARLQRAAGAARRRLARRQRERQVRPAFSGNTDAQPQLQHAREKGPRSWAR